MTWDTLLYVTESKEISPNCIVQDGTPHCIPREARARNKANAILFTEWCHVFVHMLSKYDQLRSDSTGGNSAGTEHHLPKKMKECTFTFMGCMPAQSLQENGDEERRIKVKMVEEHACFYFYRELQVMTTKMMKS